MSDRVLYTLPAAAERASVSVQTIRRAILATDPAVFPPPLRAKRLGPSGAYRVRAADLDAWVDSLMDA